MGKVRKFWLAAVVGEHSAAVAWQIVHQVAGMLKAEGASLFVTDGNRAYEQPLLSHFGQWPAPTEGQRRPRWQALPTSVWVWPQAKKLGRRRVIQPIFGLKPTVFRRFTPVF